MYITSPIPCLPQVQGAPLYSPLRAPAYVRKQLQMSTRHQSGAGKVTATIGCDAQGVIANLYCLRQLVFGLPLVCHKKIEHLQFRPGSVWLGGGHTARFSRRYICAKNIKTWSIRIFNTIFRSYVTYPRRRRRRRTFFWPEMGLVDFPSKRGRLF